LSLAALDRSSMLVSGVTPLAVTACISASLMLVSVDD